ncbi:hypothetical protein [Rufibacter ruber]|uniref:hypothetical protein n=1 Tax=Rufibacter ruber TaxID=1783499 RepID=UPI0008348EF2|nr:hypothetical protein [Rufibacter ruber]
MLDQDLKNLWQKGPSPSQIHLNQEVLLQEIRAEATATDQKIKTRDRREIGVALVVLPVFALTAWLMPFPLTKLGAGLVIPWCLLIVFQLKRARQNRVQDFSAPLQEYLHQYRQYLLRQAQLLKSAWYWYILPFTVCMVLFICGFPLSLGKMIFNLGIILGMSVFIYLANRHALKHELQPLLIKVERALSALKE